MSQRQDQTAHKFMDGLKRVGSWLWKFEPGQTIGLGALTHIPDLTAAHRGALYVDEGAPGQADELVWIRKNAANQYAFATLSDGIDILGENGADLIADLDQRYVWLEDYEQKGVVLAGTGPGIYGMLPVGVSGKVLKADSTANTGLAWATPEDYTFTRTLGAAANTYVQLGQWESDAGEMSFRVAVSTAGSGITVAKTYTFSVTYSATGSGVWQIVRPIGDVLSTATIDFDLLINSFQEITQLRLRRRAAGTEAVINVRIWYDGDPTTVTYTAQSGTSTDATVRGLYAPGGWGYLDRPFQRLLGSNALADVATAQSVFPSATDALSVQQNMAYQFEAIYHLSRAAGTTSHTISTLFGGTATFTTCNYFVHTTSVAGAGLGAVSAVRATAATATVVTAANTDATENNIIRLTGHFSINAAGTIIPQVIYSAAPGGAPTVGIGSFFRCQGIGPAATIIGGPWS
jgi:hypothetical protein